MHLVPPATCAATQTAMPREESIATNDYGTLPQGTIDIMQVIAMQSMIMKPSNACLGGTVQAASARRNGWHRHRSVANAFAIMAVGSMI